MQDWEGGKSAKRRSHAKVCFARSSPASPISFGKPKRIDLRFNGCEIFLPAEARRALILIASELVINSLKYAFSDGRPGTIDVSLWEDGNEGQLVVGDDRVGFVASATTG